MNSYLTKTFVIMQYPISTVLLIVMVLPAIAQNQKVTQQYIKGTLPLNYNQNDSTKHFLLFWNEKETSENEISTARETLEVIHNKVKNILGNHEVLPNKFIVTFNGEGVKSNNIRKIPHVDQQGRIHLYRYKRVGYLQAFPHEFIHAIRINKNRNWDPFFEEGFASVISSYLRNSTSGFPLFGFNRTEVAAYFYHKKNLFIPIHTLQSKHYKINYKCQLQSYIIREDFFAYLLKTYGLEKLLTFSEHKQAGILSLYPKIWGYSFSKLVQEWETEINTKYAQKYLNQTGHEFITKSPAKFIPLCKNYRN